MSARRRIPSLLIAAYVLAVMLVALLSEPVAQDLAYHDFANDRSRLGIPNFADVVSNAVIFASALWGLCLCVRPSSERFLGQTDHRFALLLFAALVLTAAGSTWYHLAPDNHRLFWDRLPLSIAFTALIAWLAAERSQPGKGVQTQLWLWVSIGPAAATYWYVSELAGAGDVRFYLILHGFMLITPPLLLRIHAGLTHARAYWWAYAIFLVGMAGDVLDHQIFTLTHETVSGHNIKHVAMGLAVAVLAGMLALRSRKTII